MELQPNVYLSMSKEANLSLAEPELVRFYRDYENRVIQICEEIDDSMLSVIDDIIAWNREDKGIEPSKRKPIKLMFNSVGGSLDVQDSICSIIKLSKTPVYGYAISIVASAASLIYMSCHKKFALPTAYFVLHRGSVSNISGNFNDVINMINDYQEQVERMVNNIISNSKYTEEEVKANIEADWYVRANEALEKGIVDEIITDIDAFLL